jgi:N6-adenosine-specific RNA methylase IME4/DNA-binding XRE family transcriptional regulator
MNIDNEFKSLIPPLTTEEYAGLEQSIISEGCRDALITWQDTLIDGHNRHEICSKRHIEYKTAEKAFDSRDDVMLWIIDNQFSRRNLPVYERGVLALKKKDIIARQAKNNQSIAGQSYSPKEGLQKSVEVRKPIDTQKELAKIAGISHDTIYKIEKIEEKATPEVKQKIKSGEVSINQAYQTVKREEKLEVVKEKFIEPTVETTSIDISTTDKKYSVIYADPAWSYFEGGNKNQSLHYKTMSIEEICNLPVKRIADDNCILFLWVTYPILQECFKVIESWGFNYSTCGFVWVKKNKNIDTPFIGCGNWTRANSELCLIATKGQVLRLDASISQIIESPIDEHSKKPAVVRKLITKLVGELPRIELFSRHNTDGWDVWGNEV